MKKHILFFVGLIIVVIVIALITAFSQVGLPGANNQIGMSQTFGRASGGGVVSNLKMMATDQAVVAPMSASIPAPAGTAGTENNIPRKITKTGSLSILVDTAEGAVQNIQAIAAMASPGTV